MSSLVYPGGHAVMLDCNPPAARWDQLMELAKGYGDLARPDSDGYHITLQFVGRDLTANEAACVIRAAMVRLPRITVTFTGKFLTWQTKKASYLVAEVDASPALLDMREVLRARLRSWNIVPQDQFAYKPHMTLAEDPANVRRDPPPPIEPWSLDITEAVVKYGQYSTKVQLQ